MRLALLSLLMMAVSTPALAEFARVDKRDNFVNLVQDRDLTRLGIRLKVTTDGKIKGRAFGQNISGDWNWNGGYFCRDLFVNGDVLDAANCQKVEVRGDTLRFTSDKGRGDFADLRLK
ncbi:MAG: dihydrodipicolinate reductase [Paracoccaceae bacterium]|nr:dihydrodipicolinate reductase [Paracoccaceae bacterium]